MKKKFNLKDSLHRFMTMEYTVVISVLIMVGWLVYGFLIFTPYARYIDVNGLVSFYGVYRVILGRTIIALTSIGLVYAYARLIFTFKVDKKMKEMDEK